MKLLLIEDEKNLAKNIQNYLDNNEYICEWVDNVNDAIEKIDLYEYDVILLDLGLYEKSGFEVLDYLKKENRSEGIIIISAKDSLNTRLDGLKLGADDYMIKPFHLPELLLRIQALIRRKKFNGINKIEIANIVIDLNSKSVKVNNVNIELTKMEYNLILYLVGNKNRVLSKSAIAEHLSGDSADFFDNFDIIYAHIKNLKKKLKIAGSKDHIKTIYGLGYKWLDD